MPYKFNPFTCRLDYYEVGGGGTPGGQDTQVQFNDNGSFAGDSEFTWDKTNKKLTVDKCKIEDFLSLSGRNSDPTNPSNGDIWYRSDLNEIRIKLSGGIYKITVSPV
ncbi:MAG: hypothetical protein QXS18_04910 [Thermoplasmata archaeon]